jgi:hypothetical protein
MDIRYWSQTELTAGGLLQLIRVDERPVPYLHTQPFPMPRSTSQVDSQPHGYGSHAHQVIQQSSSVAGSSHSPPTLGPSPASPMTNLHPSGFLAGSNNSNIDHSILNDIARDQINLNVEIGTIANYGTHQDYGIFTPIDSVYI